MPKKVVRLYEADHFFLFVICSKLHIIFRTYSEPRRILHILVFFSHIVREKHPSDEHIANSVLHAPVFPSAYSTSISGIY